MFFMLLLLFKEKLENPYFGVERTQTAPHNCPQRLFSCLPYAVVVVVVVLLCLSVKSIVRSIARCYRYSI